MFPVLYTFIIPKITNYTTKLRSDPVCFPRRNIPKLMQKLVQLRNMKMYVNRNDTFLMFCSFFIQMTT